MNYAHLAEMRARSQPALPAPTAAPAPYPPRWNSGKAMALACAQCNQCVGLGSYVSRGAVIVCRCVYRAVFRACFNRWRSIGEDQIQTRLGSCAMSHLGYGVTGRATWSWSRPREEYRADFELVARRSLDEPHWLVFRMHFLGGLDWKVCCGRLRISRGNFFHAVYRVEGLLGKAYAGAEPYPLFPMDEYFAARVRPAA